MRILIRYSRNLRYQRLWRQAAFLLALACLLATSGCRPGKEIAGPQPETAATPAGVLRSMIEAYRAAAAYSDRGVLCLRYEQQGTRFHDEAPLAVVAEGGRRLRVHAYQADIVCDGNELMAHVAAPGTNEMGRQVLLVPAPPVLTLETLLADPILQSAVTGGAGRLPIQLELLFAKNPLAAVLPDTVEKRLLRATRVEGHPCHGVEAVTGEGRFVFWIDQETFLLRRLEYPAEIVPADLGAVKPRLSAEFRHARFASTGFAETFLVSVPQDERPVTAFVVPPAPLPSTLLGTHVDDFHFLNPAGADVTAQSLAGRIAVLLWFSDHPACKSALQQLEIVRSAINPDEIAIIAVCTESSQRSHQDLAAMLQDWGVQIPLVRDLRAVGRDRFALPGAPALVVLDASGVVQVFQVGANPALADDLRGALGRLLLGDDLAAETRAHYEADLAAFQSAIQSSRPQ